MNERSFDRETLLDLSVNAIPLTVLLFFIGLYALVAPFPADSVVFLVQMSLMTVIGVALAILTYYSAKAISAAESEADERTPPGYSRADAEAAGISAGSE